MIYHIAKTEAGSRLIKSVREKADLGNLSERVERELRHRLMAGRFRPGQRLNIAELALGLGTSVTPIREALFRLAAVHAVEFRRGYSVSVPVLSRARYLEICEIRKANESLAASAAARHMGKDDIEQLEEIFRSYLDTKEGNDVQAALELNLRFRFFIYERAEMPILLQLIENLWLLTGPQFTNLYPLLPNSHQYEEEYAVAVAALRKGDGEGVANAIRKAIDVGTARLLPYFDMVERA